MHHNIRAEFNRAVKAPERVATVLLDNQAERRDGERFPPVFNISDMPRRLEMVSAENGFGIVINQRFQPCEIIMISKTDRRSLTRGKLCAKQNS